MIYCREMMDCNGQLHARAREGIRLFNLGRYFEAHEELEAAWREEHGRIRELYQGILEAGVTYLHLKRGNLAGAEKVLRRSMRWLDEWPEDCRGARVGQLRRDLEAAVAEARRLGVGRLSQLADDFFKPIAWSDGPGGSAKAPRTSERAVAPQSHRTSRPPHPRDELRSLRGAHVRGELQDRVQELRSSL